MALPVSKLPFEMNSTAETEETNGIRASANVAGRRNHRSRGIAFAGFIMYS
jgi:hypothetical protein